MFVISLTMSTRKEMMENLMMQPIVLKGHGRPITKVVFNRDGDLIFSSSKDTNLCIWRSDTGEQVGFIPGSQEANANRRGQDGVSGGHTGAIFDIDVTCKYLFIYFIYFIFFQIEKI